MKLDAIHHIAIITTDYEVSRRFYVDILGFEIIAEHNRVEQNDAKLDLKINETTQLEIFVKPDSPARLSYPEAAGLRHLAFKTNNIEENINYLKEYNIKVEELRIDDFTDEKMVFFYDPDNLPIELHE